MISPYLLRPLRSLEEVLAERLSRGSTPVEQAGAGSAADKGVDKVEHRPSGRPELVVIDGSKR